MLVVALGNRWRLDDGVAFEVAARLRQDANVEAGVVETDDVLSVLERWPSHECVVIVDAVCSASAPGTVHTIDASAMPVPADWGFTSSHQVGLAHAIEIARALGLMPGRLFVVGIEGGEFGYGVGLTPEVSNAIPRVAEAVRTCLREPALAH